MQSVQSQRNSHYIKNLTIIISIQHLLSVSPLRNRLSYSLFSSIEVLSLQCLRQKSNFLLDLFELICQRKSVRLFIVGRLINSQITFLHHQITTVDRIVCHY